jgi:hypothetical protein
MQGTIFTSFSEMVIEKMGMECWNDLLDKTKPDSNGVYTAGAQYNDNELIAMVKLLSEKSGIAINDLLNAFGEYMFDTLYENSPADLSSLTNLKDFLLAIDSVIHSEVKRVHPSAYLPSFKYHDSKNGDLILEYSSKRKLCYVATGLIRGAAAKFSEKITISHPVCMHNGADHCEIIIHFEG